MRLVVNALAITNLSGRHVVRSHLAALREVCGGMIRTTLLVHAGNRDLAELGDERIESIECPAATRHWAGRAAWERTVLPGLLRRERADVLLMTSGMALPGSPVPQVVLAMNPWCFVRQVHSGCVGKAKAALQRRAYRHAVSEADGIAYLSAYLRDAYHREAQCEARRHEVTYTVLPQDVLDASTDCRVQREPGRILCVSAMAPHKGVETLLDAMPSVIAANGRASLTLAGGWPDGRYGTRIRRRIAELGLASRVRVTGHLERAELLREYAKASVFALFSWCESFGIPGLEAQAFGTPVVCARSGAMPEVYGDGSLSVPTGDVAAAAEALTGVLGESDVWERLSRAAFRNASRFTGTTSTRTLVSLITSVARPHIDGESLVDAGGR